MDFYIWEDFSNLGELSRNILRFLPFPNKCDKDIVVTPHLRGISAHRFSDSLLLQWLEFSQSAYIPTDKSHQQIRIWSRIWVQKVWAR